LELKNRSAVGWRILELKNRFVARLENFGVKKQICGQVGEFWS
jgi:hypothetical protein